MKALTDKIIENLKNKSNESFNDFEKRALNNAIKMIKRVEQEAEFEEIARQLMKYLADNYHPHVTALITSTNSQLLEGLKSTGEILDYIKD
jgi:hypothetical protein